MYFGGQILPTVTGLCVGVKYIYMYKPVNETTDHEFVI